MKYLVSFTLVILLLASIINASKNLKTTPQKGNLNDNY